MTKKMMWLLSLVFSAFSCVCAADKAPLRVFVSVDMEGIWGVVHSEQTSAEYGSYNVACTWMAQDVNAVVEGLLEAGAEEIVVNDSHGSMRNLKADELHPKASLISGTPKPLSMMQGIGRSFDACIFVGYHAKAGSAEAILDHTISGATIRSIKINGREMPEMGLNGALAGYFRVPVIMVSGDTETCEQAKAIFGSEILTAAVKEGLGRTAAKLLPAGEARRLLKEKAKEALAKRNEIPRFEINPPYNIELEFHRSSQAEMPVLLPQVKRLNARAVGFSCDDLMEGFKLMRAVIALASQG